MTKVSVKAVEGRIARDAPNGNFIPSDRFVTVDRTHYVARLIDHWGDLVIEPKAAKPVKQVGAKPTPTPFKSSAPADKKEVS